MFTNAKSLKTIALVVLVLNIKQLPITRSILLFMTPVGKQTFTAVFKEQLLYRS